MRLDVPFRALLGAFTLGALTAVILGAAALNSANSVQAQEPPPGVPRTDPWADDSPCARGARYYVATAQWQAGVCSPDQQNAYDTHLEGLLEEFQERDIRVSSNPCSVNYLDLGKYSGTVGWPSPQNYAGVCGLLNTVVFPVDRFGVVHDDLPLMNGLGAGFVPPPAPFYQYQAVDTNPNSPCFGLEADSCLRSRGQQVPDSSPQPAIPPVRTNGQ